MTYARPTSYRTHVMSFESYRLTDKHTESTKIMQHVASRVLNNTNNDNNIYNYILEFVKKNCSLLAAWAKQAVT